VLEINVKDSGTNDIVDINLNYSNNVAPALMLTDSNNFKFSSEQESGSRTVNYLSAGYEGGYVYALENSSSIDYSIILRNTFFAQGLESEELDLSNETIVSTHSSEKYTIRKDSNEIVISVPDGYLITGLSYSFYQESTSINLTSLEETEAQTIDTICNSYSISLTGIDSSFFKLLSITIIESYSIINIDNDSDLVENNTIYYFYGYGEDITTVNNPARLGFNNFERVEGISLPTKTGYNFKGYKYNTTDDIVVSESGSIEPDFDQLKPTGNMSSVLTNTINAVWEGKTYNIYYYVDISSSSIIDEATKTITFGSPIGTMFNIVNDFAGDKAKKGFDFVAWVNKQTGSIVTEETIHNVDSSLYVYATWQECEYTNTFSWVSGKNYGSIKHNDSEIMSSGQDNYEHQGVKYENSKKHRYEIVANDSLLKYISVNGLYVEFDYSYGQLYNSAPYYDLEVSDSNIDGGSPTINKSWYYQSNYYVVYTINLLDEFYSINVTYHLATNKFIYTLSVVNLEDLSISVGLEQVQSVISYEVYNEDLEQLDETLVTISSTGADSITPSQNKTITFTPNSTSYISGVVVSYNGLSLNAFSSVVNVDGTQTVSLVNSNYFTKEGDAINLKSSSVSIVYDSTSRAITISLSGVYHDIDIRVNTNTFMIMSFSVPTDMNIETGFTITINSGDEGVVGSELDDIIALYEGDIVRTTGLNQINYVINGLSSVIQSLKIETYVGDDAVYYLSSSNGVLNESKTQLVLDRTTGVNQISITGYSATLTVDNKVYEGASFTQDQSGVERGLISKVTLTIADSNYTYEGGSPSYTLNGVTFIVDVLEVEGYKVDSLNAITGVRRIDEPISGGTRYIFTVTDFDISSFTLSIKYRANEYDVTYYANNGDAEEQTQTSHHIYNVSKGLNTNTFTKTNYHFVGWSTERLTGASLTENDATYSAGQQVKNLKSIENGTVSLYAVWEADLFTFNFNNNKGDISTDITPDSIPVTQLKFDNSIPELPTLSCDGYTFDGWALKSDGSNKVEPGTILNQDVLNLAQTVNGKQITLYAIWVVKTYNIVIDYNDLEQGNGSTESTTLSQTYQVVFDDAFPIIPAVERFGYNFVGYKDIKLTSDQDKTNSTSKLVNDSTILNKQFLQNATIDHSSNEVTIYATWIAKVYTANFNLNKDALEIYDDEFKFKFNGAETEISNFTLGFEFDKGIPALPMVDNGGYSFMGWFISSDYDVSSETGANSIVVGAIIDQSFINLLSLADEKFTLYAHYKINKFTMRVTSIANAKYNISSMNDYLQYTNVDTFANAQHAATYASDVVFDLLPNAGYYFNNIKVIYKTSTGASETKEIVIDWSSGTKTISFTGSTQDNYVQVKGQVAFGLEGVYIKVCSYNDADGIDANRVVIAVKDIKNVISVQASTQLQTYKISYFAKLGLDGQDDLGNQTVNYGHTITTLDVPKVYEAGYAINHWEYGIPTSLTGNVLFGTDKVYQDFNITGVYDEVLEQKINFYYWDIETNEYKLRTQTSDQYILGSRSDYGESWQVGANYDDYIVDGKVVKMPVVSNEIYPVGTVLVGYIIADGNLTSGDYYSWTDSNASSYIVFDKETIIDKEFDVYAVYQQQSLSINGLGNNRFNVSNNVYEVEESGWVSKISADNIYLVLLTQAEYNRYSSYVSAGNNNEVALGYAVNHNLEGRLISANNSIIDVNSNIPDSNTYYLFAIAIKESSDGIYIYYVAPNLGVEIEKL